MRHSTTKSLFERRDVVIVASVSCIYGLGSPETYHGMHLEVAEGEERERDDILRQLVALQYERNDYDFRRGTFRVRGDVVEVFPASDERSPCASSCSATPIEAVQRIDPLKGQILERVPRAVVYPASHYVTPAELLEQARESIKAELAERLTYFRSQNRLLEAQRLEQRTLFDLEMLREIGYCHGIENYSRHLAGRRAGETPATLIDYLPKDTLVVIDESHVGVPQLRGMHHGDRSRKEALVEYGFRLPSAFDNRPLTFDEFTASVGQVLYVSATPAEYELTKSEGAVVEQIIRPTGLTDPDITVRPAGEQVDDLMEEIRGRAERDERVLVTTLTKRMAEDLTQYYLQMGLRVRYLHSDIDTLERVEVIRDLRLGKFDALIGINLLREGLDLPEVSLVAILDADKEGYLRSATSLDPDVGPGGPQRPGRGDHVRRPADGLDPHRDRRDRASPDAPGRLQRRPRDHAGVDPALDPRRAALGRGARLLHGRGGADRRALRVGGGAGGDGQAARGEMKDAAKRLDFERAAELRDRLRALRKGDLSARG